MLRKLFIVCFLAAITLNAIACSGGIKPSPGAPAQDVERRVPFARKTSSPTPTPSMTPSPSPTSNGVAFNVDFPGSGYDCSQDASFHNLGLPTDAQPCATFVLGDSITATETVIGYWLIGPPCDHTYNFISPFTLSNPPPNGWSVTFSPASYTTSACHWATTVSQTIKFVGGTGTFSSWGANYSVAASEKPPANLFTVRGTSVWSVGSHPAATPRPTPSPGLAIIDLNLQQDVTTPATPSAVVGQQQNLQAVNSQPSDAISNCNWTIGGNTVGGYTTTSAVGMASPEPTSNVLQVPFFWIGSGQNQPTATESVSVTCTDQSSNQLKASAAYLAKQPTFTGPSIVYRPPTAITVYTNGYHGIAGTWIAYGNDDTGADFGVQWNNYAVTADPAPGPGQITMQQIISTNNTATNPDGSTATLSAVNHCADGFPYAPAVSTTSTWSSRDAPGQQLSISGQPTYTSEVINYSLQDYFMYQPPQDNLGASIWATLATSSWVFQTNGTNQQNTIVLSNQNAGGTQPSADSTLPTWSCTFK